MLLKRPGNVLLANNGPAVIDWAKVARGPVGADVADHLVIAGGGSFIKRPPRPGCRHPLGDTCSPVRSCRWSIARAGTRHLAAVLDATIRPPPDRRRA